MGNGENGQNTEMMKEIKPFTEMDSKELFSVLTGGHGIMAQMNLQNILRDYLHKHKDTADLVTMVRTMAEGED